MKSLKEALIKKHAVPTGFINIMMNPGDDLQEWDIVVMGFFNTETRSYEYYQIGIYHSRKIDYRYAVFHYWDEMKDTFTFQFNGNKYIHMVVGIYRPKGKNIISDPDKLDTYNDIDKNKDYVCIYKNIDLVKKFNVVNKKQKEE